MFEYIQYFNIPAKIAIIIIAVCFVIKIIEDIIHFNSDISPHLNKLKNTHVKKKKIHDTVDDLPSIFRNIDKQLKDVNDKIQEIDIKINNNDYNTKLLMIDTKRNTIIDFASYVIDETKPVTREQFRRVFKIYEEYENIISEMGQTNGEVAIAFQIIQESYEAHVKNCSFIEEIRGYGIEK